MPPVSQAKNWQTIQEPLVTLDPNNAKSAFLREMIGRGHVYQITDEQGLDAYCASGVPTVPEIV